MAIFFVEGMRKCSISQSNPHIRKISRSWLVKAVYLDDVFVIVEISKFRELRWTRDDNSTAERNCLSCGTSACGENLAPVKSWKQHGMTMHLQ